MHPHPAAWLAGGPSACLTKTRASSRVTIRLSRLVVRLDRSAPNAPLASLCRLVPDPASSGPGTVPGGRLVVLLVVADNRSVIARRLCATAAECAGLREPALRAAALTCAAGEDV